MIKKYNPWKTISTDTIFKNPWIELRKDDVITPTGKTGTYTLLQAKPFVIVVAIQDDAMVMIEQFRYPIQRSVLEFPAGGLEIGEQPLAAAQREFKEETGYEARTWTYVGEFFELISISHQPGHLFIAHDLKATGDHNMAEDGISKHRLVRFEALETMIDKGSILDALTPAVYLKVRLRLAAASKPDRLS